MSDLTPCNYCTLQRIKRRAKEEGKVVTTKHGGFGLQVFVHAPDEKPTPWTDDGLPEDSNQVAEFMALTSQCAC